MPSFPELAALSMGVDPHHPRPIPESERRDAANEVLKQLLAGGLDLPNGSDVEEALPEFQKASVLHPVFQQYTIGSRQAPTHTAVINLNEFGMIEQGSTDSRWLEKSYVGGFKFLRDVVAGTDLIQAIIRTRVRQVFAFLVPEREEGAAGFRIQRRDGQEMTDADSKAALELELFVQNSGDEHDPCRRDRLRRQDLEGFVTQLLWDTLTADACPIELVRTAGGRLTGYHALDFETIRLCSEAGYQGDDQIRAVQLIDATPYASFTFDDILYDVRTPRTDLRAGGYGYAETEGIVRAITGYLDSFTYNSAGISRSTVPRGLLTVFGEYDNLQQQAFTRQWRAMLTGAGQRHSVPTLFSKSKEGGAVWTPMDQFNEMFFARWITLLVSICAAQHGIDPTEINFDSFSTRTASLGGKADTAEKLAASRDKGLVPTLRFVQKILAKLVELRSEGRFTFRFVGIEPEDAEKKHERIKLAATIDEIRKMNGQEPHEDPQLGKAPANPSLMAVYMQKLQAAMQPPDDSAAGPGPDGGPEGPAKNAGDDEDDYPTDAGGRHSPYRTNPFGGDPEVPDDEHLHSIEFGKAVAPPRRATRRPRFRAVVVQHAAARPESWDD